MKDLGSHANLSYSSFLRFQTTKWLLGMRWEPCRAEVWDYYVRKRVPERYRRRGSQNARRYCDP